MSETFSSRIIPFSRSLALVSFFLHEEVDSDEFERAVVGLTDSERETGVFGGSGDELGDAGGGVHIDRM